MLVTILTQKDATSGNGFTTKATVRSEHGPAIDLNSIVGLFSNRAFEIGESLIERSVLSKEDFDDTDVTSNRAYGVC